MAFTIMPHEPARQEQALAVNYSLGNYSLLSYVRAADLAASPVSTVVTRLPIVEHDKARNVLADYWQAVVDAGRGRSLSVQRSDAVAALNTKILAVNHFLRELAPDLPLIKATSLTQHRSARAVLDKAEALLNTWEKLDDASAGESPALPLMMLDPVVADAALPLWQGGKYRQAVNDAATNLNLYAQQQLGRRDISDKSLMGEAFSDKPPEPGKARLRCYRMGRPMESVQSQQEGARALCTDTSRPSATQPTI